MNNTINIGDYVGILDATEKGYAIKIEKNKVWIETDDGFEITSLMNKLVKYPQKKKVDKKVIKSPDIHQKMSDEKFPTNKKPVIKKVKDKDFKVNPIFLGEEKHLRQAQGNKNNKKQLENTWEFDLHIEEITDHYNHLTNGEILDIQLRHVRMIIEKARKNKMNKVIFIHGKGKGTLRNELLHVLSGYTFLEFYDASFKLYGGGAMEVKIFTSKT